MGLITPINPNVFNIVLNGNNEVKNVKKIIWVVKTYDCK
jgi:hypothetical protein